MSRITRNVLPLALGVAIGLALGTAHAVFAGRTAALGGDLPWKDARLLAEVLESVKQNYVMPVGDHQLLQAATRGMVASLDPYSEYLDRDEYDEIKISSSGEYTGVGLELSIQDDQVVVVAPFTGSPAAAAGIRPGDVIATIDGMAVNTANLAETIDRMRGKRGTTVRIGILRGDGNRPLQFSVERERVELHSARATLLAPGFGYLRIAEFSDTTGDDVTQALRTLRRRNGSSLKGLVVDLRDNPGGVLDAAVAVADDFLDKGVIVSAKGRTPDSNFQMNASPGDLLAGAPIVVLVDGGSASAAEIVAGALKDHHRAVLMGRRTFGKGSVQTVTPLPGGGALKLTTSLYYTPSGASINHKGIAPDIELPRNSLAFGAPEATGAAGVRADPQVERALEELKLQSAAARAALSAAAVGS